MIEVEDGVWVGNEADVDEFYGEHGGFCIHAAKEPYHRKALGYTGRAAPKEDPEYLVAVRDTYNAYNLVDSPKPEFIPKEIFDHAANSIAEMREKGVPVLINCNQGKSRSVGIYLYYLVSGEDGPNTLVEGIEYLESLGMDVEMGDGVLGALTEWLD